MSVEFRQHDSQYDILRKLLGALTGGATQLVNVTAPVTTTASEGSFLAQLDRGSLVDSFGRFRVSSPVTVLEAKHIGGTDPQVWDESLTGFLAADEVANSVRTFSIAADVTGTFVHQTFRRAYYQAGKSQLIEITFNIKAMTLPENRETVEWAAGAGDGNIGVSVGGNGNPVGPEDVWFVRTVPTLGAQYVTRSDWNVDKLDGFGPSGKTLNMTAPQLAWFDGEWLGVGALRCGFIIDGQRILCHTFYWNNVVTTTNGTYGTSLTLPLRYSATVTAGNADGFSFQAICGTVKSEGGQDSIGRDKVISRGTTVLNINSAGVWFPLCGLRLKAVTGNYAAVRPANVTIAVTSGTSPVEWGLFRNPTFAGTAVTWASNSIATEAFGGTTNATSITGTPFHAGYAIGTNQSRSVDNISVNPENQLGLSILGVSDTLVLGARSGGTNIDVLGNVIYREAL